RQRGGGGGRHVARHVARGGVEERPSLLVVRRGPAARRQQALDTRVARDARQEGHAPGRRVDQNMLAGDLWVAHGILPFESPRVRRPFGGRTPVEGCAYTPSCRQ